MRSKEDLICYCKFGVASLVFAGVCALLLWIYDLPKNTVREWLSTAVDHGICLVKLCDKDHRCPVWDGKKERCIMEPVYKSKTYWENFE